MYWDEAIAEYGFDCKVRKLSPKTIDNYLKQLRYFKRFIVAQYKLEKVEKVQPLHIKQFLSQMDDKGCKPRYINDLLKVLKTFYYYLQREGYVKSSPAKSIKNMKQPKTKIITFSGDEIRKLLNYFSGKSFLEIRNRTMLALFFDTGMRLSEVIYLQWEQIREEYILVHGKGAKERVVPVSPYLGKALLQYRLTRESYFDGKLPERYVFVSKTGKKLTAEAITKVMKQAASEIKVNPQVRVSPHTCRHTFAHQQLKNGIDLYTLSRLMGHESVAITQRYLEGIKDDEMLKRAQKFGVLNNL